MSGVWYGSALCVVAYGLLESRNERGPCSGAIGANFRVVGFPLNNEELFQH